MAAMTSAIPVNSRGVGICPNTMAAITVAIFTRHEGFGLNKVTALASVLYAALLLLFVLATKETTAANAIFLQYTSPVYLLILEPLIYKEKFRRRDLIVVTVCVIGMSLFFVGKLWAEDEEIVALMARIAENVSFALDNFDRAGEKARADTQKERLGRMLAALSATNEAIVRATSRTELFELVCEAAAKGGRFNSTSIMLARSDSDIMVWWPWPDQRPTTCAV